MYYIKVYLIKNDLKVKFSRYKGVPFRPANKNKYGY